MGTTISMSVYIFGIIFPIYLVSAKMDSFEIDLNDILNERLMPATLFLVQHSRSNSTSNVTKTDHTDMNTAFSTMGFHRKMMNEYLCSNFVAKQIIDEIVPKTTFERRIGTAVVEGKTEGDKTDHPVVDQKLQENLLYDEGSSGYKNWLKDTTTLEDIYKQFANNPVVYSGNQTRKRAGKRKTHRRQGHADYAEDEYEEGDITGYAVHQPMGDYETDMPMPNNANSQHPQLRPAVAGSKNALPNGQQVNYENPYSENYLNFPHYPLLNGLPTLSPMEGYYPSSHENYDYGVESYDNAGKQLGVKEVMEIALITLAFLSFGMFVLQVLMCITMNKQDNSLMMMPMEMEMNGNGDDEDDGTEEIRRKRRSIGFDSRLKEVNEISRKVLISIDAVINSKNDNGACLHRVLCEFNAYARQKKDGQKFWIPVWSLGLSWLSSRFAPLESQFTAMLGSLKATAFGLGKANCHTYYSECEFEGGTNKNKNGRLRSIFE